jgi:hypothetical protein
MQVFHRSEYAKPRPDSPLCIIFMRLGIPKIHEEPIAEELGDMSVIALNHLSTGGLIRPDHVPVLFGIESAGEGGGIDEVTEHHRELTVFGFCGGDA